MTQAKSQMFDLLVASEGYTLEAEQQQKAAKKIKGRRGR